jgi:hypothetical protein
MKISFIKKDIFTKDFQRTHIIKVDGKRNEMIITYYIHKKIPQF